MTEIMVQTWEENVREHADDRLSGPRGSWWFTGKQPLRGECPGITEDGTVTSLPMPDLSVCDRAAVLDYFDNSWTLQETLFAGLQTAEAFYRPPSHGLRHPMIFYYGHPAALYVNKLRVAGLLSGPVDAYLEDILETGVDEMSWDDMSKNEMTWPSVARVHAYRAVVYGLVRGIIEDTPFAPDLGRPVTDGDQAWALFMGFEHDRIHLETSSVLIRELPRRLVERHAAWPAAAPRRRTTPDNAPVPAAVPQNAMVQVAGGTAIIGKPRSFPSYGWDNEYGEKAVDVAGFAASRYLISNGEFYRFVQDGGYRTPGYWSEEGWGWRQFRNAKHPRFWEPDGPSGLHRYRLRTIFEELDMPWDWPVCVNYHEAKAYCAWRGREDGRSYRLPTEAEFRRLRGLPARPAAADDPVLHRSGAQFLDDGVNLNLALGSESPVDQSPAGPSGVHDTAGNLWQWCEDVAHALDGFDVHPYYEDFSTPCFDGEHQMILGGAFISTGDEASIWARFHFRPHFLQQSGLRIVSPSVPETPAAGADAGAGRYATKALLDSYLLLHYGSREDTFDRKDHYLGAAYGFPQRLAALLAREAARAGARLDRVLDLGCAVGGVSLRLAADVGCDVVGVDSSASFIAAARRLAEGEQLRYDRPDQGAATTSLAARAPSPAADANVEFRVADAAALPGDLGAFDAVILANLLDRVGDPRACLRQLAGDHSLLRPGGLLLVTSPWSWQPGYADPAQWIGGAPDGPSSEQELRALVSGAFELVAESDEPGVLRNHRRHYETFQADVSLWRKR
ncbi:5-histidylcysteine sulfoxide synthase [Streptomyces boncukensis]|uniref:5-histidylcysteine sulfoxide synthase n=1 Tax=Streptomyces boncukensis TaxID=2711219 RepID=A0A6G4WRD5_9ACTN|nr:5-histidylcysteine sulfoxide synthase [Streptomyces boncukensis]NGO67583.1 5-histidylcysteine sulfoxide synthase [Streptomyces boncukensis]